MGVMYQDMLQQWLMLNYMKIEQTSFYNIMGLPLFFLETFLITLMLNFLVPWIGCASRDDNLLLLWSPC